MRRRTAVGFALAALVAGVASLAPQESGESPPPDPTAATMADIDLKLRRVQDQRRELEREVGRLRGQERSLLGEVERLEVEVRLRGQDLEGVRLELQRTRVALDSTLKKVTALEGGLSRLRPLLAAHARMLYKLGELSYLRLMLSVDRPSDFFRGYRFVTSLARRDNDRVARFRSDLRQLEGERAELQRRTDETIALRAQLDRARRSLDTDRRKKTELLTSIVSRKEVHAAYLTEVAEAEGRLSDLLRGATTDPDVAVPIAVERGRLPWPVEGRLRTGFGRRKHPRFDTYTTQNGADFEAIEEAPVRAVHEGKVAFADRFRGYGLMVVLDHGGKHHTLYAHLASLEVETGQRVKSGEEIGRVGSTGVDGPGLYFEVRFQGQPEDPLDWLKRNDRAQGGGAHGR